MNNTFRYTPKYRPAGAFTLPKGWRIVERPTQDRTFELRTDLPVSDEPFGIVEYDRRLTDEEIERYELRRK